MESRTIMDKQKMSNFVEIVTSSLQFNKTKRLNAQNNYSHL